MNIFVDDPNIPIEEISGAIKKFTEQSPPAELFPITLHPNQYGFLFEELQSDPANLLNPIPFTARRLVRLGASMVDAEPPDPDNDSRIPSGYTYLGQFIDHDITRHSLVPPVGEQTMPLSLEEIRRSVNLRTPGLDLDSLYGPAIESGTSYNVPRDPRNNKKLKLERMAGTPPTPELPRETNPPHPPFIGDRRNDQSLMGSQMHLAFMLAHNRLIDRGESFETARQLLRRHYQWMVVHDYLFKVADPDIVNSVLNGTLNLFDPPDDATFIPLEFSVAGFRFAHSMIRDVYNYNQFFERARLFELFLPGFLVRYHHIPVDWLIDWRRFIDGRNMARRIDAKLARGLTPIAGDGGLLRFGLATLDLLRGYQLRVPTGEAVARRLGEPVLTIADMLEAQAITPEQAELLVQGGFESRTPLWFYVLVEAHVAGTGRLGRVGSKIVASVVIGLARKSKDSYFRIKDWNPTLGTGSRFDLPDLFQLAGVLVNDD